MKNPFRWFFKARDKPQDSVSRAPSFYMGPSVAGNLVNERSSMQTTAVYACVRIIAESIASLPLQAYRNVGDGKEKMTDHPLYRILHDAPNPEMTSFTLRETMMAHLLLWGNAYCQIVRSGRGDVLGLYPLLPDLMTVDRDSRGAIFYNYRKEGQSHLLGAEEILHIPGLGFDGVMGYSPIALAKNAIGLNIAAEEYGGRFFANNATPSGILSTAGVLKDPGKVRDAWQAAYGGLRNSNKVAVLEDGLEYKPISMPHSDAQFLETRKFQIEEICRIFQVPPHLVADLSKSSFCLPADAEVYTCRGPKRIVDIQAGELVWSLGENGIVPAKVKQKKYSGEDEILTIRTTNRTLRTNGRHRILVRRKHVRPQSGSKRDEVRTTWTTEFVPAEQLVVGDTIVTLNGVPETGKTSCPTRELTEGFMEFCGFLMGNGSVLRSSVTLAHDTDAPHMNQYRETIVDEFVNYANNSFRTKNPILKPVKLIDGYHRTAFASVLAVAELRQLGLSGNAHTKRVPDWVFETTETLRLAFLRGYLDADGSVCKKGRISFSSVSKVMLSQMRHLCLGLGIPVTNLRECAYTVTLPQGDPYDSISYTFTCSDPGSNRRIGSHTPLYRSRMENGRPFDRKDRKYPMFGGKDFSIPGCALARITSISRDSAEKVYDLEVEGTHTFVADGVVVHNSNIENQSISFVVHTIRPWLVRIEQAMNRKLFKEKEQGECFVSFNASALLRGDYKSRMDGYAIGIQNGFFSVNDVRRMENLDPIPEEDGGDLFLTNGNLLPLRMAGAYAKRALEDTENEE